MGEDARASTLSLRPISFLDDVGTRRTSVSALGFTVVLHVAALVLVARFPVTKPLPNSDRSLVIQLVQVASAPGPAPVTPAPPRPVVTPRPIPQPEPTPVPVPIVEPTPEVIEMPPIDVPVQEAPVVSDPEPMVQDVVSGPFILGPLQSGAPDIDGLGRFKNAILAHLERYRNYPKRARDRGIDGKVLLEFVIAPDGRVQRVALLTPNGSHPLLEQAALETIRRASPLPRAPERLQDYKEIVMQVSLQYELK